MSSLKILNTRWANSDRQAFWTMVSTTYEQLIRRTCDQHLLTLEVIGGSCSCSLPMLSLLDSGKAVISKKSLVQHTSDTAKQRRHRRASHAASSIAPGLVRKDRFLKSTVFPEQDFNDNLAAERNPVGPGDPLEHPRASFAATCGKSLSCRATVGL